jgi:mRNA-degrading endonuclease RelE of RelBE toxin-antitoxin system
MMYTTVRVEEKTKQKLEALKEYDRETFDSLLNRLADNYPEVKDELVKDIVKEADEYYKKGIKHKFSSSDDLRKLIEG